MKKTSKMDLNIQEITYINEMALTIGFIMLTIGNSLEDNGQMKGVVTGDGIQRNLSIDSIMVYAFVIHARFVPCFKRENGRLT
jgi:hypothetical protein